MKKVNITFTAPSKTLPIDVPDELYEKIATSRNRGKPEIQIREELKKVLTEALGTEIEILDWSI